MDTCFPECRGEYGGHVGGDTEGYEDGKGNGHCHLIEPMRIRGGFA